jgi:hypothetical protein
MHIPPLLLHAIEWIVETSELEQRYEAHLGKLHEHIQSVLQPTIRWVGVFL